MFLGNPGAGKSTILNALLGQVVFTSGPSIGHGLKKNAISSSANGIQFFDTPGLDDSRYRDDAAAEISRVLNGGENIILLFVVTLESGRIRPGESPAETLLQYV